MDHFEDESCISPSGVSEASSLPSPMDTPSPVPSSLDSPVLGGPLDEGGGGHLLPPPPYSPISPMAVLLMSPSLLEAAAAAMDCQDCPVECSTPDAEEEDKPRSSSSNRRKKKQRFSSETYLRPDTGAVPKSTLSAPAAGITTAWPPPAPPSPPNNTRKGPRPGPRPVGYGKRTVVIMGPHRSGKSTLRQQVFLGDNASCNGKPQDHDLSHSSYLPFEVKELPGHWSSWIELVHASCCGVFAAFVGVVDVHGDPRHALETVQSMSSCMAKFPVPARVFFLLNAFETAEPDSVQQVRDALAIRLLEDQSLRNGPLPPEVFVASVYDDSLHLAFEVILRGLFADVVLALDTFLAQLIQSCGASCAALVDSHTLLTVSRAPIDLPESPVVVSAIRSGANTLRMEHGPAECQEVGCRSEKEILQGIVQTAFRVHRRLVLVTLSHKGAVLDVPAEKINQLNGLARSLKKAITTPQRTPTSDIN